MYISLRAMNSMKIQTCDNRDLKFLDLLIDKTKNKSTKFILKNKNSFNYLEFSVPTNKVEFLPKNKLLQVVLRYSELDEYLINYNGFQIQPPIEFEPIYAEYIDSYEYLDDNKMMNNEIIPRSIKDFLNLNLECIDGKICQLNDIYLDPKKFTIQYMSVSSSNGIKRKYHWCSIKLLEKIDWSRYLGYLNITYESLGQTTVYTPKYSLTERINDLIKSYIKKSDHLDKDGFLQ